MIFDFEVNVQIPDSVQECREKLIEYFMQHENYTQEELESNSINELLAEYIQSQVNSNACFDLGGLFQVTNITPMT